MTRWGNLVIGVLALGIIALSVFMLERGRAVLVITDLAVVTTPATLYQQPGPETGRWWWWRMVLPDHGSCCRPIR